MTARAHRCPLLLLISAAWLADGACSQAPAAPQALQLVGQWTTHVERVRTSRNGRPGEVTMTLLGLPGTVSIDRGDRIRVDDPASGAELTGAVVTRDTRDAGDVGRVHVRVRLDAPDMAGRLAELAPALDPELPEPGPARDAFVRERAPRAVVTAEFEPDEGDRLVDFVRVEHADTGQRVDPEAAPTACRFVVRFSEPVDAATLGMDSLQLQLVPDELPGAARQNGPQPVVPARISVLDASNTTFAVAPPLGLRLDEAMRQRAREDRDLPEAKRRPHFRLHLAAGANGIRARSGRTLANALAVPVTIDPAARDNHVAWRIRQAPAGR